jgi:hypothetical protein
LARKHFVATPQIHKGYAPSLRTAFSLKLLQISDKFNCRFKVYDKFLPKWIRPRDVIAGEDRIKERGEAYLLSSSIDYFVPNRIADKIGLRL